MLGYRNRLTLTLKGASQRGLRTASTPNPSLAITEFQLLGELVSGMRSDDVSCYRTSSD